MLALFRVSFLCLLRAHVGPLLPQKEGSRIMLWQGTWCDSESPRGHACVMQKRHARQAPR